ncbi:hypothetical protein OSTOST_09073 [Ostertagia ostertagi]
MDALLNFLLVAKVNLYLGPDLVAYNAMVENDYYASCVAERDFANILQFGFVTLFVVAFPLAPLFAVLNNIFEIRLDAYKFLITIQKPVPAQALVIAFTSDFIPKTMYYIANSSMIGYVNSSLSYFDATDFEMKSSQFYNVTQCRNLLSNSMVHRDPLRYRGFRRSPCSLMSVRSTVYGPEGCDDHMGYSLVWWKVFAARLLFVVIFESPRKESESSYTTAYQGRGSVQNLPQSGAIE